MSTRGAIAVREGMGGAYFVFYRHHDTYPTCLGVELLGLLTEMREKDEFFRLEAFKKRISELGAGEFMGLFSDPEGVFRKQGDMEWIYLVDLIDKDHTSLAIFRTSNPWLETRMTWRVWSSFLKYLPKNAEGEMQQVENVADSIIQALAQFEQRILEKINPPAT